MPGADEKRKALDPACAYGEHVLYRVERNEEAIVDLRRSMNRLVWALVGAAITFGTAAVMLGLNLATP